MSPNKNKGSSTSGAVQVARSPDVVLTDSNFTDNIAEGNNGGAVFWRQSDNYVIQYCNFYNNTAKVNGGVFYSTNSKRGLINYCNFTENKAETSGGALNWNGEYSNLTNCIFTKNIAEESGAINVLNPNGIIRNCTFVENTANSYGSFYWSGPNGLIENCDFINGSAMNSGGAFCIASENVVVNNCNFINLSGQWGGAIRWDFSKYGKVSNCNFTNITATELGGAVYWRSAKNGEVSNCIFIDCASEEADGSVYWRDGDNGVLDNCTFINSYANTTGGAITWSGENGIISNCYFNNTLCNYEFGEIINWGSSIGEIKNCTMENSNALYSINIDGSYPYDGMLYLEKNDFDCYIYLNDGNILSSTYLIILSNETLLNNGTPINLSSQLYDDNNNEIIFNKKLKYVLSNGSEVETSKKYWTVEYTFDRSGVYYIDGILPNLENLTVLGATIDVKIPAEINVTNETINLKVSDKVAAGVILTPPDAGNLTYTSSDENVATVVDGMIIAVGEGNATITVSLGSDSRCVAENKTINVTVSLNDASVCVNNETLDLLVGDTFTIIATTTPEGLNVTYIPDESGIYTVDANGTVTALKEGNATITVKVGGDGIYIENTTTVTVSVSKVPSEITVNSTSLDLFVGDETAIIANLTPADAGNVTFTSSDDSVVIIDAQGNVIANGKGQAIITLSFAGDNKYAAAENKTINVTVSLNDASVTVENDTLDLKVDETYAINATKHPDTILLDITYTSSDNSVATVDENGIVTAVGEGTAIITVEVGDDEIYAKNSTTVTVSVKAKENANISIDAPCEAHKGDNVTVTVTLPEDATGTVTIGNEIVPVQNGTASAVLTDIPLGNNTVPITYSGDDKYKPIETSINISVKKDTSLIISAPDVTKYYHGSERFVVSVTDKKGAPLANKSVSIVLNGVPYTRTTNANGTTSIALNLASGVYNVSVTVDNQTVDSVVTILTTVNGTDVVKVFRNATQYFATFRDTNGNYLVEGTEVEFNINGVFYTRKVTQDGLAKLNINLQQEEYIITAVNLETGEMASNNITVISRIIENSDLRKYFRNASQYTIKIIGDDGNPVGAGEVVTFNINGVLYNRTTNASGIAKMNINLAPGDYVITAEYKGCKVSNNITVLPILYAEDITMNYHDGTQFFASLVDGQGKPYARQGINFNINGVLYTRYTDSTGQARLNINLMAGEYIITSSYNGANIANKITIRG